MINKISTLFLNTLFIANNQIVMRLMVFFETITYNPPTCQGLTEFLLKNHACYLFFIGQKKSQWFAGILGLKSKLFLL